MTDRERMAKMLHVKIRTVRDEDAERMMEFAEYHSDPLDAARGIKNGLIAFALMALPLLGLCLYFRGRR